MLSDEAAFTECFHKLVDVSCDSIKIEMTFACAINALQLKECHSRIVKPAITVNASAMKMQIIPRLACVGLCVRGVDFGP